MNMESISEQLLATGFFSSIELVPRVPPGHDLAATARLTGAGHCLIAREGLQAFRSQVGSAARGVSIKWHFITASNPWPVATLERSERLPAVLSHLEVEGNHRLLIEIDPGLCWFEGHFPGQPILAGVVQLHWAGLLTQKLFGYDKYPERIARLKFQHLVVPPTVLELMLTSVARHVVHFRFDSCGQCHSQGRLNYNEPDS